MAKKQELVVFTLKFDYTPLESQLAEQVRASADRIRAKVQRTLEDLIAIGNDLRKVKEALGHGQFGHWLQAEFGWTERTARHFLAVAECFGKSEIISDLQIQPTAAYLLAAQSAPDEARQVALERAEAGERITARVAKEILTKARKRLRRKVKPLSPRVLAQRLRISLERFKGRWDVKDLAGLVRHLRDFADELDREQKRKGNG